MEKIETKMKKEVITKKEFTEEFATTYQYQIAYADVLIKNLELFGRILSNEYSVDDSLTWFAHFYIKNTKGKLQMIPTVTDQDIEKDYKIYREFVLSELQRLKPLIDMHYYSMLGGVKDLERTIKRIDAYKNN